MPNERKTENLVRDLLRAEGYYSNPDIIVEEQRSDAARVNKLLTNASKKGDKDGHPEFIITSRTRSDFMIIVECKANPTNHESKSHDRYADYAVDGALLYASFLAKELDVVAIAVSGETKAELRITHHVHLKGLRDPSPYFSDQILSFDNYVDGVIHSPIKFNQDLGELIQYTKALNEHLQDKKIKESQRALLISGILIALRNDAFKTGYRRHRNVKSLVNAVYGAIGTELDDSKILPDRVARLKAAFAFIKSNTSITEGEAAKAFVENLIANIDQNVMGFMQTHAYVDTVSQFYVEFLRYANQDTGLGIVVTPAHICDLFVELAGVDRDSIVFDNCCGTGGFLVSAMKHMMKDANGDAKKEQRIKSRQLAGIEYQEDIYALAVSNMIIHLDGKTNVVLGDCFEDSAGVKETFAPNVGLLNPPYKTKKSEEELEYVLNNLETLAVGGVCVAIVPFSCVNDDATVAQELKRRVLEKHTLEAVMSMPEEVFHDSKVNVVTCAVVITAHKPHPRGKKTWFGYWRNDGFVKVKNRGRVDANHTWADIKTRWVDAYRNREMRQGFSVSREVNEREEWCAEAYMETDYSTITREEFERVVRNYAVFRLLGGMPLVEQGDSDNPGE